MNTLRAWLVAVGALGALAFAACSDDDNSATTTNERAIDGGPPGSSSGSIPPSDAGDAGGELRLVLLHTNDLHGHLQGHEPELDYSPATANDDTTKGGFARLAAHVAANRAAAASAGKAVVLADAGDFMMGTLFSSYLGPSQATELYEMSALGYDAIALGNHEFDFTSLLVAGLVQRSIVRGKLPPLVATNISAPAGIPFRQLIDTGLLPKKKVITTSNGVKIGFVGIMGANAAQVAPLAAPVTFDVPVAQNGTVAASIQSTVDSLRNDDKVDLVFAVSHSGTDASGAGEDRVLAEKARGIDVIVSGHTHVELPAPVKVTNASGGNTYIVSAGAYGLKLGKMELTYTRGKGITVDAYALESIDDSVAGDTTVQSRIDGYVTNLNALFTDAGTPLRYFGPVGGSAFDLPNPAFQESGLGDLITDSFLAAAAAAGVPGEIGVEVGGNIRSPLLKGKTGALAFADVFNVEPLGIGPDGKPGLPLVGVYLTAKDIVNGLTLSSAAADPASSAIGLRDNDYFLQVSGAKYTYDLTRGSSPLQRLTQVKIGDAVVYDVASDAGAPNDTVCYRTVMTYYVASLLGLVSSATGGALTVSPKGPDCSTVYTSGTLPNAIIRDGSGAEIKQWQALVGLISSFPSAGSGPVVPARYATPAGRITKLP
jgi:5'-nucleotidase / UDP-sugar diphosphatase